MANYTLTRTSEGSDTYIANETFYSNECAESLCGLFLRDEIYPVGNADTRKYYRLHSKEPLSVEKSLTYNLICPKCRIGKLKVVGRCINSHELGLYECPVCNRKEN